jgi:DNA-binding MarR family transcriptional regulator
MSSKQADVNPQEDISPEILEGSAKAFLGLLRAATDMVFATEKLLRENEFGVNAREWDVLAFTVAYGPLRPSELLRHTVTVSTAQTLSSVLGRLERRDLIIRFPDDSDSRSVLAAVTPTGRQLVDEAFPIVYRKLIGSFNSQFDADEVALLGSLLERL